VALHATWIMAFMSAGCEGELLLDETPYTVVDDEGNTVVIGPDGDPITPEPGQTTGSGAGDMGGVDFGPEPDLGERAMRPTAPLDESDPYSLDQDRLFTCVPGEATLTRPRVWRLNGTVFVNSAHNLAGSSQARAANPFAGAFSSKTFSDYADNFSVAEPELNAVLRSGRTAAKWAIRGKAPGCVRNIGRDLADGMSPQDPFEEGWFDEGCRASTTRWAFQRLLNRSATEEEVARYDVRMKNLVEQAGLERGITASIMLFFTHPEALFRYELGEELPDGRRALTPHELAQSLAATLARTNSFGARTLGKADDGTITDEVVLRETIRELLDDDKRFPGVMRDFLSQYFKYKEGSGILKEFRKEYNFNRSVGELERFLDHIVEQDTEFVENLLSSTVTVDSEGMISSDPTRPGILNRVAWLASFSKNEENDPIKRGHFIREEVLCLGIPEIPIGVVAQLPDAAPDVTLRERLVEHADNGACSTCHRMMDPLGLPFEQFDHYGIWRDMEAGRPVDTSGEFFATGPLDGPVMGPADLVQSLATSPDVERCVVRHVFRYVMGRDETYGDACTLADAHQAYTDSDGSLRATFESLMTSDTYLYRQGEMP